MEKKTIGEFIAVLRKANGLTQRQLAETLQVSDKSVSRWERNETAPDLTLIPVIAEIFGITSDELLRGERRQPGDNAVPDERSPWGEKQIQRILSHAKSRYLVRCIVSMGIALIGVIVGCCFSRLPLRHSTGFAVGLAAILIGYFTAVLCQAVSAVTLFASVSAEEFAGEQTEALKTKIIKRAAYIIGGTGVLSVVSIVFVCGFEPFEFFALGPIWGIASAVVFVILWQMIKAILIRRGCAFLK